MDNANHNRHPPQLPRTPSAEGLAAKLADPSGPPQPVASDDVLNTIAFVGVILVALGGLMVPVFTSTRHTAGATRSAKLEWENRQQQIEQAIQAEQALKPDREQGTR